MNTLLVLFAVAVTAGNCADVLNTQQRNEFDALDTNNDQHLVRSEFDDYLKQFDPDGTGSITPAEFRHLLANTTSDVATKQFRMYDKNNDNVLDFKDSHIIFDTVDENSNGIVTPKEFADKYYGTLAFAKAGVPIGK